MHWLSSVVRLTVARSTINFNGLCLTTTVCCLNGHEIRIKFFTELGLKRNHVIILAAVQTGYYLLHKPSQHQSYTNQ